MKKVLVFFIFSLILYAYNVKEFVTCKDVQNLTPVEITDTFTINDKKVYAFANFTDIKEKRLIDFVWEKQVNGEWKLYADIKLPIFAGERWRTYSNISIKPFFEGKWRVSLIDGNETVESKTFEVVDSNNTLQ